MGAIGGAIAGSLAEDALKKKKKEKKKKDHQYGGRRNSSSSSSSSSSDDEKKKKKYALAGAGAAGVGTAAYIHHHGKNDHGHQPVHAMRGNFSASSTQITLDRDYDLIASCSVSAHLSPRSAHHSAEYRRNSCFALWLDLSLLFEPWVHFSRYSMH
jgi:hypothetical protein